MSKRTKLILRTIIALIGIVVLVTLRYIFLANLNLSYEGTTQRNDKFTPEYTWIEITSESQKQYYLDEYQLKLPIIDFNKNYMIISKYKIYKAYYTKHECICEGAPEGLAIFNYFSSQKNYYIYRIPKILISQGIG
ncbi:hypothetical protein H1230_06715 [Paenibacillus sp. 19GGS1-52]|uniref:hypothetical protein n=1 Tax=Paenibacillus sp. 19GGS1-52 TaxID=2758563 RepID=UPI001EFBE73F|nr:hypothetical protein [Paenibacillus sp. 19GGS1-52]ULO08493.1 hypothetical protein H1230_06715 [Paenibacillus sp. 19GGS1-52]